MRRSTAVNWSDSISKTNPLWGECAIKFGFAVIHFFGWSKFASVQHWMPFRSCSVKTKWNSSKGFELLPQVLENTLLKYVESTYTKLPLGYFCFKYSVGNHCKVLISFFDRKKNWHWRKPLAFGPMSLCLNHLHQGNWYANAIILWLANVQLVESGIQGNINNNTFHIERRFYFRLNKDVEQSLRINCTKDKLLI